MIDELLDELLTCSEILADSAAGSRSDTWSATLAKRSRAAQALAEVARSEPLTPEQALRLRTAIELGGKARFPIAAKRENLRVQLNDLRENRRNQQALKPYRRTNGRRLNVSG